MIRSYDPMPWRVLPLPPKFLVVNCLGGVIATLESPSRAELIVQSVNGYAALVAALECVLDALMVQGLAREHRLAEAEKVVREALQGVMP